MRNVNVSEFYLILTLENLVYNVCYLLGENTSGNEISIERESYKTLIGKKMNEVYTLYSDSFSKIGNGLILPK